MHKLVITAASEVTGNDVRTARLGPRFGRMDLMSQLALLAVESLGVNFDTLPRERIAICLASATSSLATDAEYWNGRDAVGGLSPTLFTYTLPSAAIGEIAIRHRLTGPNLCFVGGNHDVLPEAAEMLRRGEADGCLCVFVNVVSPSLAQMISTPPAAGACAVFLRQGVLLSDPVRCDPFPERGGSETGAPGPPLFHELGEFDRDMETLCAKLCARKPTT
jgi:Beta-ketoacyl synthase, N-terminal domain